MDKKGILCSVGLSLIAIFTDFLWKMQVMNQGPAHINKGFIFGTLQDLPPSLTLVTLSSMGGLLTFIYLIFIILLSRELFLLKAGLGLLIGGVLGNVIDRAIHGGTLDFIPLNVAFLPNVVFNPADVFQWIGAAIIAFKIITKEKIIWYPENQRGYSLINKNEQLKFAFKFSLISISTCLVLGIFAISYMTLTLNSMGMETRSPIIAFAISFLAITFIFSIISFFTGLILSQRTAGPLYAFEKYVEDLLDGKDRDLKLRQGDNYRHLEVVANNLRDHLRKVK
jgi:signal peptidase II